MFLKIPDHRILDFGMVLFAEHVLDTSPTIASRSQMRTVMRAVDAIAEARDGIAEMAEDAAKAFQAACEAAPVPPLTLCRRGASGKPLGEPQPVPRRAFEPFYEAVENMTTERPLPAVEAAPPESLPVAAE